MRVRAGFDQQCPQRDLVLQIEPVPGLGSDQLRRRLLRGGLSGP